VADHIKDGGERVRSILVVK